MQLLKKVSTALSALLLSSIQVAGQGVPQPAQFKAITLTQEDIEHICTLRSTGKDVFYYRKAPERRGKQADGLQTASFQVNYISEQGNQPWPQAAIDAFEYAIDIWETHIHSDIPIRINANWVELGEFTLGSAGPSQIVQIDEGEPGTWYTIAQGSAMAGVNFVAQTQGLEHDIIVNMNANWDDWYFGTDAQTPNGLIDFVTVVLHEVGHGLGFTGSMNESTGSSAQWGYGSPAFPIIYDRFVIDGNGFELLNQQVYGSPSQGLHDALTGERGGIYFAGIESIVVNDGEPVPLYAPSEWNSGSSYSHVDLATYSNTENALMRPQIDRAFAIHAPGPVTCGMFGDMGWPLAQNCGDALGAEAQAAINNVDENHINFGVSNAGSFVEQTFSIMNDLNSAGPFVGRVGITGGTLFSVDNRTQIIILEPGESANVRVRYNPTSAGQATGELEINHNGSNLPSPVKIALSGEALAKDEVFKLEQNYPNPFNTTTSIPYVLAKTAQVKLDIFDAMGKHVQTLVNTQQPKGRYNQPFRANKVSSGMYIYRIIVDGEANTGKLLLVK